MVSCPFCLAPSVVVRAVVAASTWNTAEWTGIENEIASESGIEAIASDSNAPADRWSGLTSPEPTDEDPFPPDPPKNIEVRYTLSGMWTIVSLAAVDNVILLDGVVDGRVIHWCHW